MGGLVHKVDYYELLGVQRHASTVEIKTAYRALAKVMHPDAGGTAGTFRLLQEAYETLNDPSRRARYDHGDADPVLPAGPVRPRQASRRRDFGPDPDFEPATVDLDPGSIPWWSTVDAAEQPAAPAGHAPGWEVPLGGAAGWLVLLAVGLSVELSPLLLALWLLALIGIAGVVVRLARRYLADRLDQQTFAEEFAEQRVFGEPGADQGDVSERLTAELLETYLTRLPGVRIFHGVAWPGSRFADIDHAVLCGRRLVLIESKLWLPGRYAADPDGTVWRNDHIFRGGHTRLAAGLAAFRTLLPDLEIRGALILYPCRSGEITTDDSAGAPAPPMTPAGFVHEIGGWLATEPAVLDRDVFRTVLRQVVS